jgi:Planctomycete cytochrome C
MVVASCRHEPLVEPADEGNGGGADTTGPAPYAQCDPDTIYFEQDILPLLISNCTGVGSGNAGCHNAENHESGVELWSYGTIMDEVTPGDPSDSDLLTDGIWETGNNQMPPNGPLSQSNIDLIVTWIQQGAPNNSCVGGCDTTNVTYSGTIQPILQSNCSGSSCHDANDPAGNINLTNHAGAAAVANNGHLAGAIQHAYGYTAMPPNLWLSQCDIDKILIWVQDGAPNN